MKETMEKVSWRTGRKTPDGKEETASEMIPVQQFDSLSEAASVLGEAVALKRLNTQHRTTTMNVFRQGKAPGAVSKETIRAKARARITLEEFQSAVGDESKLAALEEKYMAIVQAELEDAANSTPEAKASAEKELVENA